MFNISLAFFVSLILTFVITRILIKISNKYNIYDIPSGRKQHRVPVSFLGGLAIFSAFYISYGLSYPLQNSKPYYSHTIFMVLFTFLIFGLADDFLNFKANKKFALQFILISIFLYNSNDIIKINEIIGIKGNYTILNLICSIVIMNIMVNSINLIDGSDGIAISIAVIIDAFLCYYFLLMNDIYHLLIATALLGSLIAFLYFNKPPAKIFMGNGGSLFLGMILSILTFKFLNNQIYNVGILQVFTSSMKLKIVIGLFSLPAFDLVRVMLYRIYKKRNPFIGDSNHIHHKLKAIGFNSKFRILAIVLFQLFNLTLAFTTFYGNSIIYYTNVILLTYSISILIISQIEQERKSRELSFNLELYSKKNNNKENGGKIKELDLYN